LDAFLRSASFKSYRIQITDNGSTDQSGQIGKRLAQEFSEVQYIRIKQRGRGLALRHCWQHAETDIVSYMDVDLSTDLESFKPLVSALTDGGADIAVGSRREQGASVQRDAGRKLITHAFNWMLRHAFDLQLSDTQCGFKGLKTSAAKKLLPLVCNNNWFFDTELLLQARRLSFTIAQIPVTWSESQNPSTVKIPQTALEMTTGILRMKLATLISAPSNENTHSR
jgi:glycosyltransferase involved in cell wall biosynthesis